MEDTLTELVGRIKQSTDSIGLSAGEIDAGNSDLSRRTEAQVSALAQTAASMEQLTATVRQNADRAHSAFWRTVAVRSEEHTSELQSHSDLVCRLLLEKKNTIRHILSRDRILWRVVTC